MKKLSLILAFLTVFSCAGKDQKIHLELSFDEEVSVVSNSSPIQVLAFDDRAEKTLIGKKEFCDKKIKIVSDQDVMQIIKDQIEKSLMRKGFVKGKGRVVELHLERLKYKSECEFFIGESKADIAIKVVVRDVTKGNKFTKNFEISVKGKHFIVSSKSTDQEVVNAILLDMISDILSDESFLESLHK